MYAATWARRLRGARPSRFIIVPIGFGRASREWLGPPTRIVLRTKYLLVYPLFILVSTQYLPGDLEEITTVTPNGYEN